MGGLQTGAQPANQFLHARLGTAFRDKTKMTVRIRLASKYQLTEWEGLNARCKASLDPTYMLLPLAFELTQRLLCNDSVEAILEFEIFPGTLKQELESRRLTARRFEQEELWRLCTGLLQAAACFERLGVRGADIRPRNILLNSKGEIRLLTVFSSPL